jgi:hypothetical protein
MLTPPSPIFHFPTDSVVIFSEKDEFEKLTATPAKTTKRYAEPTFLGGVDCTTKWSSLSPKDLTSSWILVKF